MQSLCFATGNLRRLIGKKDIYEIISKLDIDGIELSLGSDFVKRTPTESNQNIFRNYWVCFPDFFAGFFYYSD